MALLIASLCVTGLFTNTPFGMKTLPWQYFDKMIESEKKFYESDVNTLKEDTGTISIDTSEYSKQRWKYISQFNSPMWRLLYSIFFIIFVFVINGIIDTISFSFSRLMLNEMIQTKSVILLFSVFLLNAFISIFIATIVLFLSMLITMPSIAGVAFTLVTNLLLEYPSWTSIGLFAAAIAAWNLSGVWFKVLAITTIFPSIIFCFVIFSSIILNPAKKSVFKFIKLLILKALEHDKGIFAFFTILFTSIGAIIGSLVKIFGS